MRILKEGRKRYKMLTMICANCGCEFTFDLYETKIICDLHDGFEKSSTLFNISCPQCDCNMNFNL